VSTNRGIAGARNRRGEGRPHRDRLGHLREGDYDVWVREFDASGKARRGAPRRKLRRLRGAAGDDLRSQRRAVDLVGAERADVGQGLGRYAASGIPLYRDRQIGLAILQDGAWMETAGSFVKSLPGAVKGRRQNNVRVRRSSERRDPQAGEEAEAKKDNTHNNIAASFAIRRDASGFRTCKAE